MKIFKIIVNNVRANHNWDAYSYEEAVEKFHKYCEIEGKKTQGKIIELDIPSKEIELRYVPTEKRFLKSPIPSYVEPITSPAVES